MNTKTEIGGSIFSPPDEQHRRTEFFQTVVRSVMVLVLPVILYGFSTDSLTVKVVAVVSELSLLGIYQISRMGFLRLAQWITCLIFYSVISTSPLYSGPIHSLMSFIFIVFLAINYSSTTKTLTYVNSILAITSFIIFNFALEFSIESPYPNIIFIELFVGVTSILISIITINFYDRDIANYRDKSKEALNFLKQLSDLNPSFIFAKDSENRYTFVNHSMLEASGLLEQEFMGKTDNDLNLASLNLDKLQESDNLILNQGSTITLADKLFFDKERKRRWFDIIKTPIRDSSASIIGILGIAVDKTLAKEKEEELENSLWLLEATLESTADGIIVINSAGKVARFNEKYSEMWNLPEEIVSEGTHEAFIEFALSQLKNPDTLKATLSYINENIEVVTHDYLHFHDGRVYEQHSQPRKVNGCLVGRVWSYHDITAQEKIQQALKDSEQRYRNLFSNSFDAILVYDFQQKMITNSNEAACSVFRCQKDDFIGQSKNKNILNSFQSFGEQTNLSLPDQIQKAYSGNTVRFYGRQKRFDGENFESEMTIIPNLYNRSELILIIKDISDAKRYAAALHQKETLMQTIINSTEDFVLAKDTEGKVMLMNDAVQHHLSQAYGVEIKIGERIKGLEDNELAETYLGLFRKSFQGEQITIYPKAEINGQEHYYITSFSPIRDQNQTIIGSTLFSKEITSVKEVEIAMRENEEKYRVLFENSPLGILLLDSEDNFKIVDCNSKWLELAKFTETDLIGSYLLDRCQIFAEDELITKEELLKIHKKQSEDQKTVNVEWLFKNNSEYSFTGDVTVNPVQLKERPLTLMIIRDISEKKKQQLIIKDQIKNLNYQNQRLTEFNYIVSHNLRGSVANLIGLSGLLDTEDLLGEENFKVVEMMGDVAHHLDSALKDINQIINVGRPDHQIYNLVKLSDLVEHTCIQLKNQISETGTSIEYDFSAVEYIYAVRPYLSSIFYNLISNSIKYRHPERKPQIKISSKKGNTEIYIAIHDNGLGIDLEKYGTQIFSLYHRFHDHIEGKGIGLYLVKMQTEAMQGSIEVESSPGLYTQFSIRLPIKALHTVPSKEIDSSQFS